MNTHHHDELDLALLLTSYMADSAAFALHASQEGIARMDASFCVLRAVQCSDHPAVAKQVDALGLAACDMIDALLPGAKHAAHDTRALVLAHEARALELLEEIACAA